MKERITITVEKELLDWLDSKVKSRIFANRSHGFEFLINHRRETEKEEEKIKERIKQERLKSGGIL
jgi:Arc/MetJ-type ribon-helix-helix transcriptional regulator